MTNINQYLEGCFMFFPRKYPHRTKTKEISAQDENQRYVLTYFALLNTFKQFKEDLKPGEMRCASCGMLYLSSN